MLRSEFAIKCFACVSNASLMLGLIKDILQYAIIIDEVRFSDTVICLLLNANDIILDYW